MPVVAQRIGIFGGTFDPIHNGHLAAAEECRVALALDRVLFLPAGDPPHKRGLPISPVDERVAMIERAIAANDRFQLSRIDVDRAGPSYTVDTLEHLRAHWGVEARFWFIVGADSLADILTWRQPARLIQLARFVAVNRPGAPDPDPSSLEADLPGASERIDVVEMPDLAISASDLRDRVRAGRPIRYQVPDVVHAYIIERGLYRASVGARMPT